MDTESAAPTGGTASRAGTTAPVTVPKAAQPVPATTAGGVTVPPAGTRPVPADVTDTRIGSGVAAPAPAATQAPRPVGPRRARLLVTRLDPWSVMKTAFMLSVSVGIVLVVATALLWWTLDITGVFAAVARTVDDVVGTGTSSFDFQSLVGFSRVMGVALVLTAVEVVLWSALATLAAFLYNLSVGLTGGLEVTLSEDS